jgi:microcystin-dependent protein
MNIVGEIKLFAGDFIPPGFIECDGSSLPIPLYKQLFYIIGFAYTEPSGSGGYRGLKYFNLPGGEGIFPGTKWIICVEGYFPRELSQSIYEGYSSDLVDTVNKAREKGNKRPSSDYKDPKLRDKIVYEDETWRNYDFYSDEMK